MSAHPSTKPDAPSGSGSGYYRPALDGVRAVAVLAVIAYHVGARWRGGFLGVDIFFVLSGYLITTLLLRERAVTGKVRLVDFWVRRARRLLPAVLLLLGVVALYTAISTPAVELATRRADMNATLLYFANWHFIATDASYFAAFLGASPLRHMWSLAIEEQFYVVWPLVLLATMYLFRGKRSVLLGLLTVAVALSAIAMALSYDVINPSRAYFGTETHAFPLLIGAALSVAVSMWPRMLSSSRARRLAGWIWPFVVIALAAAVLLIDDTAGFYYRGGLLLFALTVAVALWLIEAAPRSVPARLLSLRPVVWVGVISYGLYLWHWPILVWIGAPNARSAPLTTLLVLVVTFAAATLSFYLLERPVRRGKVPWVGASRRRLVLVLAASVVFVAVSTAWATRISSADDLAAQVTDTSDTACPDGSPTVGSKSWCQLTDPSTPAAPVIATAGDSTSRALTPGLAKLAEERGWGYVQAGQDGCSALSIVLTASAEDPGGLASSERCAQDVPPLLRNVAAEVDPDLWIVSDRWLLTTAVLADGTVLPPGAPGRDEAIVSALSETLSSLAERGAGVALLEIPPVGPPVECAGEPLSECDYSAGITEAGRLAQLLSEAADRANGDVEAISVTDVVCPDGECQVDIDGTLVRYDGLHFTGTFSELIAPVIIQRAVDAGLKIDPGSD